jgi:hypothetical protein
MEQEDGHQQGSMEQGHGHEQRAILMPSKVTALALAQSGLTGLVALAIISGWPSSCHVEVDIANEIEQDTLVIDHEEERNDGIIAPTGGSISPIANLRK